jgi:hypothetical protein
MFTNRHSLVFIQNGFEIISKLQTRMMVSFYIEEAFQIYAFHILSKMLSAPTNCFAKTP